LGGDVMKKGIFLPLVLFFLLVLAMLGIMFNRNSQTEFRQAYFTSDMMRAHMIAEAALEEALAETRAKLNNEFRDKFIDGGKLSINLQYSKDLKSDIISLEDGATTNPVSYSVSVKAECTNIKSLNDCDDKLGTLVFEVNCSVNKVRRDIRTSYDYKVVDVRPVGNEYCFMVENASKNAFNNAPEFYINSTGSKGISIGKGDIEINLHKEYASKNDWNGIDLHNNKNSTQSLIPGGGSKPKESKSAESIKNNEPWEDEDKGQLKDADNITKEPYEPKDDCGDQVMFDPPGNFPFNCGYVKGHTYTHLFGVNCNYSNTKLFGQVKGVYSIKEYKYTNIPHVRSPEECDRYKQAYEAAKAAAMATIVGAAAAEAAGKAAGMAAYMTCACSNPNDWTDDDRWEAINLKEKVTCDYKTSDSELEKKYININADLNYKGNFRKYKEVATRYVETFPGDIADTFYSGSNLYLEGVVACSNAAVRGGNIKTPGVIVTESNINFQGAIKGNQKLSYDSGSFFKQPSVLSLVAHNGLRNSDERKENTGFFANNLFDSSSSDILGNLVIMELPRKNFGEKLTYDKIFSSSEFCSDSGKAYVISVSPIPSSYIVLNN
jgi:hypothetical protein